jgi:hypothetical protein
LAVPQQTRTREVIMSRDGRPEINAMKINKYDSTVAQQIAVDPKEWTTKWST